MSFWANRFRSIPQLITLGVLTATCVTQPPQAPAEQATTPPPTTTDRFTDASKPDCYTTTGESVSYGEYGCFNVIRVTNNDIASKKGYIVGSLFGDLKGNPFTKPDCPWIATVATTTLNKNGEEVASQINWKCIQSRRRPVLGSVNGMLVVYDAASGSFTTLPQ